MQEDKRGLGGLGILKEGEDTSVPVETDLRATGMCPEFEKDAT